MTLKDTLLFSQVVLRGAIIKGKGFTWLDGPERHKIKVAEIYITVRGTAMIDIIFKIINGIQKQIVVNLQWINKRTHLFSVKKISGKTKEVFSPLNFFGGYETLAGPGSFYYSQTV